MLSTLLSSHEPEKDRSSDTDNDAGHQVICLYGFVPHEQVHSEYDDQPNNGSDDQKEHELPPGIAGLWLGHSHGFLLVRQFAHVPEVID